VTVESDRDLAGLRRAGRVVALAIETMKAALEPGMTTAELDAVGPKCTNATGHDPRRSWCTGSPASTSLA
jgi:methionyl aminopeptidase